MEEFASRQERLTRKVRKKQHMVRVAMREEKADVVLKNATYVNVFSNELCQGDIAVAEGLVVGMGQYDGLKEYDMSGSVVVPGFIDAHIHLESSLVTPPEFARAVLRHGTTCVIADPHEIANVCGTKGLDYMLAATQELPVDTHFMLPSCVPAVSFEENGAALSWRDLDAYLDHPRVLGLGEMMNYPGVVSGDEEALQKIVISQMHHKKIDGHAPGLSGNALAAYMSAGVYSDHEGTTLAEGLEKLRMGEFIMIREGTAAHNLEALLPLLDIRYNRRVMFSTDDKHPKDLLSLGHIDYIARKAVALGADPIMVVRAATHNAARYFLLNNRGAIAPGYLADFAVLDNLNNFGVQRVFKRGELVFDGENVKAGAPEIDGQLRACVENTCHLPDVKAERLKNDAPLPLIGLTDGQITTRNLGFAERIDTANDTLKVAVAERHKNTGHVACAFVRGYGLKKGAVATSVAHDSHNIIAVGCDEQSIALAINHVKAMRGGIAVVCDQKVLGDLPLPIAGLVSDRPLEEVNAALEKVKASAYALGVSPGVDPFMTLSFMSLPVIPTLRITTKGVFDVDRFEFI